MSQDGTRSPGSQGLDGVNRNGIDGSQGDDILLGDEGSDILYGGAEDDTPSGGDTWQPHAGVWGCASVDASTGAVTTQRGESLAEASKGFDGDYACLFLVDDLSILAASLSHNYEAEVSLF